jgi:hypothetical protein
MHNDLLLQNVSLSAQYSRYGNKQIDFGAIQLQEDYINHWENGWFPVQSSGGVGPFILIWIQNFVEYGFSVHFVFKLVATQGIRNFISRGINNQQYSHQIPSLLNAARQQHD